MEEIRNRFVQMLEEENKEEAVNYIIEKVKNREIEIVELYENVLAPALNEMACSLSEKRLCIWKEHIKTAIVRTIVECCYPYVIEKRNSIAPPDRGTAVIICPPEEYHDLGARMVADFFYLCGCKTIFVGSNTPYSDFYNAIDVIHPDFIAISVSNYFNLVAMKRIIEEIRKAVGHEVKIIAGGNVFYSKKDNYRTVGADYLAQSFEDISKIVNTEVLL